MHSTGTEEQIYHSLIRDTLMHKEVVDALKLKLSAKTAITASKQHVVDRLLV